MPQGARPAIAGGGSVLIAPALAAGSGSVLKKIPRVDRKKHNMLWCAEHRTQVRKNTPLTMDVCSVMM